MEKNKKNGSSFKENFRATKRVLNYYLENNHLTFATIYDVEDFIDALNNGFFKNYKEKKDLENAKLFIQQVNEDIRKKIKIGDERLIKVETNASLLNYLRKRTF